MLTTIVLTSSATYTFSVPRAGIAGTVYEADGGLHFPLPTAAKIMGRRSADDILAELEQLSEVYLIDGVACVSLAFIWTCFIYDMRTLPAWIVERLWDGGFEAAIRAHMK